MQIEWSEEKNQKLIKDRKVSFEIIAKMIRDNKVIAIIPNNNYPNQKRFVVKINNYIWCVPFVVGENGAIFLKTAHRDRKLNKIYNTKD